MACEDGVAVGAHRRVAAQAKSGTSGGATDQRRFVIKIPKIGAVAIEHTDIVSRSFSRQFTEQHRACSANYGADFEHLHALFGRRFRVSRGIAGHGLTVLG
jgi:hypothetical protein